MYLFTRRTRLAGGDQRGALAWAADITAKVNQISGLTVRICTPIFSEGTGSIIWTTFVQSMAQLEDANDKLLADDGFLDLSDAGRTHTTGVFDDALVQVVHGTPDPGRTITHASAVTAVAAPGKLTRAMELGVQIAQRAETITGVAGMFGAAATGPFGAVSWVTGFESIDQMEQANEALAADAGWLAFLDKETPGVYAEDVDVTRQTLYRFVG